MITQMLTSFKLILYLV